MPIKLQPALATHPSQRHQINQDAVAYHYPSNPRTLQTYGALFALSDGVGSRAQSDTASRLTLLRLLEGYYHAPPPTDPAARLNELTQQINRELYQRSDSGAATLLAVVVVGDHYTLVHIGDSPAFHADQTTIRQLTTPHVIQGKDGGTRLNRAVGHKVEVVVDVQTGSLRAGERLILVTDGITRYYDAGQLHNQTRRLPPHLAVETLISGANGRGGEDDMSAIIIEASAAPNEQAIARHVQGLSPIVQVTSQQAKPQHSSGLTEIITLPEQTPYETVTVQRVTHQPGHAQERAPLLTTLLIALICMMGGALGYLIYTIMLDMV